MIDTWKNNLSKCRNLKGGDYGLLHYAVVAVAWTETEETRDNQAGHHATQLREIRNVYPQ
jgi:hypothetical protein